MKSPASAPLFAMSIAALGICTYAGMDAVMKGLSLSMGVYNAMLWRVSIALALATLLFIWRGPHWPEKRSLYLHIKRGTVIAAMAFLFFWGLMYVPLAEAIGLTFIAPLIALYLAVVLLGETIRPQAILASVIGFSGALVILGGRLAGEYDARMLLGMLAVFSSSVLYAYNLILQRQQSLVAAPIEIAFFQNATTVSYYWLFSPFLMVVPEVSYLPALIAAAALGIISMLLLSWAYAQAQASVLIPVEYTAFVWAALFGWLVFAETVAMSTVAGTALIVTGCLIAARQQPVTVAHVETTAV